MSSKAIAHKRWWYFYEESILFMFVLKSFKDSSNSILGINFAYSGLKNSLKMKTSI